MAAAAADDLLRRLHVANKNAKTLNPATPMMPPTTPSAIAPMNVELDEAFTDVVAVTELARELVPLGANIIVDDSGEVSANAVVELKVSLVVTFSYAHPGAGRYVYVCQLDCVL